MQTFKPNTHVLIDGNPVYVIASNQQDEIAFAFGPTTPTHGTPSFMKGAIFQNTTSGEVFRNLGTSTSSSFVTLFGMASASPLTAQDASTVDDTYGSEEEDVINNLRTRQAQIENVLMVMGAVQSGL